MIKKLLLITLVLSMVLLVGCREEVQEVRMDWVEPSWRCGNDFKDVEIDDLDDTKSKYNEIEYPNNTIKGRIKMKGMYLIDFEHLRELANKKDLPIVCEAIRDKNKKNIGLDSYPCMIGDTKKPNNFWNYPYDLEIFCCVDEYCSEIEGNFRTIYSEDTICKCVQ